MEKYEPFSVAMSVYKNDDAVFFDRALESVTTLQTVMPNEVVLVVDGPIDDQLNAVIEKYAAMYDFVKPIRLSQNVGLGNALKIAIENSSFQLIARMDSDDVSVPTRFEEQLSFFERFPNCDVVGGDITEFVDDESNIVGKRAVPTTDEEVHNYMKTRCAMNHVTVMFKKSSVQSAGGYLDCFWNEDYYLWIRMLLNGSAFANTGSVLVNVRVGKDMYKRRGGAKYFKSELFLQKFMLQNGIIDISCFTANIIKRFIVQILLTPSIRGFVFRKLAREKTR